MEEANSNTRRRHDKKFKSDVLAACAVPGASVAQVAMAHGLNANLVQKWRRVSRANGSAVPAAFIPVTLAAPSAAEQPQWIELELQRAATSVRVRWPMATSPACAAWLREILR